MMADETAAEAERAAEEAPFVDAETFGVDATEGTAADSARHRLLGQSAEGARHDEEYPVNGYLGTLAVYAGSIGLLAAAARLTRRPVEPPSSWDVVVNAAATHQLCRLDLRGRTGMCVVTGLSAGYVFAPRATRLAAAGLAALTGSDFLRYARDKLCRDGVPPQPP